MWQTQNTNKPNPSSNQLPNSHCYSYYTYKNLCLGVTQTYFPSVEALAAIRIRRNILSKLLVQLSNVPGFISAFNHPQSLGLLHMFGHPLITEELTAKSCWGFLFGSLVGLGCLFFLRIFISCTKMRNYRGLLFSFFFMKLPIILHPKQK